MLLYKGTPNGASLSLVASSLDRPSKNDKTGNMGQVGLFIDDEQSPWEHQKAGTDEAVCNDCPLRPIKARVCKECGHENAIRHGTKKCKKCNAAIVACYVLTFQAPRAAQAGSRAKSVPTDVLERFKAKAAKKPIRFGFYANMGNVPKGDMEPLFQACERPKGWTCYEHDWEDPSKQWLNRWAMASVDSVEEKERANALGWKTFRHISDESEMTKDEIMCVHTSHGVQCRDCGLCNGRVCNIVNLQH